MAFRGYNRDSRKGKSEGLISHIGNYAALDLSGLYMEYSCAAVDDPLSISIGDRLGNHLTLI